MRAIAQYRSNRIESASKPQIVLMLFQEALRRMEFAIQAMQDNEATAWRAHLHHVREIFLELRHALDDTAAPELCATLRSLYQWCNDELIAAGRDGQPARIHHVIRVTTLLTEGWQGALETLSRQGTAAEPAP